MLTIPLYFLVKVGVVRYRIHVYPHVATWKVFRAIQASKAYNLYRMFRP